MTSTKFPIYQSQNIVMSTACLNEIQDGWVSGKKPDPFISFPQKFMKGNSNFIYKGFLFGNIYFKKGKGENTNSQF